MEAFKTSMLEYSKIILQKVSFDKSLFQKELAKAVRRLLENEIKELLLWVKLNFGRQHKIVFNAQKSLPAFSRRKPRRS